MNRVVRLNEAPRNTDFMAKKAPSYRRLPGRKLTLMGSSTLWLGPDHLLCVDSNSFAEDYRRFYYHEIQSLTVLPTRSQQSNLAAWSIALAPLLLLTLLLDGRWRMGLGACAVLVGLVIFIQWLRGPTCECRLRTAVQIVTLPSLCRLRPTLRALTRLRVRIEAVQGPLQPELFDSAMTSSQTLSSLPWPRSETSKDDAPSSQATEPLVHASGIAHAALFGMLLLDAGLSALDLSVNSVILTFSSLALTLGLIVGLVWASIERFRSDVGLILRWHVPATLLYLGIFFIIGNLQSFFVTTQRPFEAPTPWERLVKLSESPSDSLWTLCIIWLGILSSLVIAVPGWIALIRFWATRAAKSGSVETKGTRSSPHEPSSQPD